MVFAYKKKLEFPFSGKRLKLKFMRLKTKIYIERKGDKGRSTFLMFGNLKTVF